MITKPVIAAIAFLLDQSMAILIARINDIAGGSHRGSYSPPYVQSLLLPVILFHQKRYKP